MVEVKKEKPLSHAQLASMSRKARAEHGSGGSHVPLGNHGTERKRMPLPVYKKSKKPARPAVSPDGTMEVVFNEKILGIHVDDREWEVGPKPKIVVTKVQENGTLAGARENWAVEAVNGVSMEELGLATHSELQTYIVSIPLRPLTLTLKTPPRPPTELELEELREAEEAKRAAEEQAKVSAQCSVLSAPCSVLRAPWSDHGSGWLDRLFFQPKFSPPPRLVTSAHHHAHRYSYQPTLLADLSVTTKRRR